MRSPSPPELDLKGLDVLRAVPGYEVEVKGNEVKISFTTDVKGDLKVINILGVIEGNKVKLVEAKVIDGEVRNMSLDELILWAEYVNEVARNWSTY